LSTIHKLLVCRDEIRKINKRLEIEEKRSGERAYLNLKKPL